MNDDIFDSDLKANLITIKVSKDRYEGAILLRGIVNLDGEGKKFISFVLREKQALELAKDISSKAQSILIGNGQGRQT